ncbi:vWA domain-containing protein [Tepidibacillus decaturensis]|uniref:VWFA domain-containing protein n=1 Tax=Tepidibacillus decaturensis TaxID=1413211 RepID=A0A135L792_9BACI|nr:VWA domain-containing protein [Tepidibacillus decaturensis]KXG44852.1 hypothetical protein U473_13125 [Tepidibacillus decaturensis]
MNETLVFNQITLITDGCSNQGYSPIEAARQAYEKGIIINVIGITDGGQIGKQGTLEIEGIAKAGGGLSQIVPVERVKKTVQFVTRQAMNKTITQVVNAQLVQILGENDLVEISPNQRLKVANMMDEMAEHSHLKVLLLIDQSASMLKKMEKVQEAIVDFQLSLLSRAGESSISIVIFPGNPDLLDIKIPWTKDIKKVDTILHQMVPQGNTPTGSAILKSIDLFYQSKHKQGLLDEYVV